MTFASLTRTRAHTRAVVSLPTAWTCAHYKESVCSEWRRRLLRHALGSVWCNFAADINIVGKGKVAWLSEARIDGQHFPTFVWKQNSLNTSLKCSVLRGNPLSATSCRSLGLAVALSVSKPFCASFWLPTQIQRKTVVWCLLFQTLTYRSEGWVSIRPYYQCWS